jgi:hypothetical protein
LKNIRGDPEKWNEAAEDLYLGSVNEGSVAKFYGECRIAVKH